MERTKQEEIDWVIIGIESNLYPNRNFQIESSYVLSLSKELLLEYKKLLDELDEKEGKLRQRREEIIHTCQETIEKCKGI